ncbi:phosphatase PAP2 family protein [Candidatus Woesearchaeota archaeon]|nr:phosphatase PAP2 family protein [Candidatus Woesearchaeota archaeon]
MNLTLISVAVIGMVSFIFDATVATYVGQLQLPLLTPLFVFVSQIPVVVAALIFLSFFRYRAKKKIMPVWVAAFSSYVLIHLIKIMIVRQRPFEVLAFTPLAAATGSSFPSGHAGVVFAMLPFYLNWYWFTFALLVALSRVYLGVHYLSDVIFGALIGYGIGLIILRREKWFPR